MPLGLHWPELVLVMLLAMLLFGAKRLPEMGSAIGKTIKEFQKSMREVTEPTPTQQQTLPTVEKPQLSAPSATSAPAATPATAATPVETPEQQTTPEASRL